MFAHDNPVTSEIAGYFINVDGKTLGLDTVIPMSVPGPSSHILKWSGRVPKGWGGGQPGHERGDCPLW